MSSRTQIVKALATKFKEIDGTGSYKSNLYNFAEPKLKFWDEINDFPAVFVTPGKEDREYHPAGFKWGFLNVSIRAYVKDEDDPQSLLENLLQDIEYCIDSSIGQIVYNTETGASTTEISIVSIATDEGLLHPYGVGEVHILVRYQV